MSSELAFGIIAAASFALATIYAIVCVAWGRLITRKFSGAVEWPTSFATGHAALGIILQLIAVAGYFTWYGLLPLGGAMVVLFIGSFRRMGDSLRDLKEVMLPKSLLAVLSAFLVFVLAIALLVDTVSYPGTDALAYYMAQPKLFAATGRYIPLPAYETFSVLPALSEMAYGVMYVFGGETIGQLAGKMSMWPVLVAILILLWQIGRRLGLSSDAAWVLVIIGATSSAITLVAWDGKTDLVALMYALVALRWLPGLTPAESDRRSLLAFGAMTACAVMAKLSYALVLPFALGIPLLLLWGRDIKALIRILVWAGLAVLIVFTLGWWLKNYAIHGDPFAPLLSLNASTPKFTLEQVWFDPANTKWIVTTYPLAVTFGLYPMQHGGISPLWLVLLPVLWGRPWRTEGGQKALFLAAGGIFATIVWMVLRPSVIAPRYFLPALLWPCFLLAFGFDHWLRERRTLAWIAQLAAIAILALHIQYAASVTRYVVRPFAAALHGAIGAVPLRDRSVHLAALPKETTRCLLLSYSSEPLPFTHLNAYKVKVSAPRDENIFHWASRNNVNCILYDPFTHKRADLEESPPVGLEVKKIEFLPNMYYLLLLKSSPIETADKSPNSK